MLQYQKEGREGERKKKREMERERRERKEALRNVSVPEQGTKPPASPTPWISTRDRQTRECPFQWLLRLLAQIRCGSCAYGLHV